MEHVMADEPTGREIMRLVIETRDDVKALVAKMETVGVSLAELRQQFIGHQELQAQRTLSRDQRCLAHERRMDAADARAEVLSAAVTAASATTNESRRNWAQIAQFVGLLIALAGVAVALLK